MYILQNAKLEQTLRNEVAFVPVILRKDSNYIDLHEMCYQGLRVIHTCVDRLGTPMGATVLQRSTSLTIASM